MCPSVFDVYIFTFDETDLCEAASECLWKLQRCALAIRCVGAKLGTCLDIGGGRVRQSASPFL